VGLGSVGVYADAQYGHAAIYMPQTEQTDTLVHVILKKPRENGICLSAQALQLIGV
jgi:hypothetical protein